MHHLLEHLFAGVFKGCPVAAHLPSQSLGLRSGAASCQRSKGGAHPCHRRPLSRQPPGQQRAGALLVTTRGFERLLPQGQITQVLRAGVLHRPVDRRRGLRCGQHCLTTDAKGAQVRQRTGY